GGGGAEGRGGGGEALPGGLGGPRRRGGGLFKRGVPPRHILDASATSLYPCGVRTLVMLLATVGGVGYAPAGSGTLGSLVALPLLPVLATLRTRAPLAGWVVGATLLAIAFWAAGRADGLLPGHGPGGILID